MASSTLTLMPDKEINNNVALLFIKNNEYGNLVAAL